MAVNERNLIWSPNIISQLSQTKNDTRKIGLSIRMIHIVDNLCTLKFETKQIWLERCTDIGLKVILY